MEEIEVQEVQKKAETRTLPLLPLRGVTAFPGVILNFDAERPLSVAALNAAISEATDVLLVSQRNIVKSMPEAGDFYSIGTVCTVR